MFGFFVLLCYTKLVKFEEGNKGLRKLALDFGDARIGIAQSDMLGIIANGLETYQRKDLNSDLTYIANLVKTNQVDTIVLGLPLNMDGTSGTRVEKTYEFAEQLKTVVGNTKIVFMDERLSTVSAEKLLISADVRRDKRKTVIDKMAATIILQSYLDKFN